MSLPIRYRSFVVQGTLFCLIIGFLQLSCSLADDAPQPNFCLIARRTNFTQADSSTDYWVYSKEGQLQTQWSSKRGRSEYIYDEKGYLITENRLYNTGELSSITSYRYVDNRLVNFTTRFGTGELVRSLICQYSPSGELTKLILYQSGAGTYSFIYSGGKQTDYFLITELGDEYHPYEFENGLIKRFVGDFGVYTIYDHNQFGRLLRENSYNKSGELISYTTYEYQEGKPDKAGFIQQKGWPIELNIGWNQTTSPSGLETKKTIYSVMSPSYAIKYAEYITNYILNSTGFILEMNTRIEGGAPGNYSPTQYTYNYTGCH